MLKVEEISGRFFQGVEGASYDTGRSRPLPHAIAVKGIVERLSANVRFNFRAATFELMREPAPGPQGTFAPILAFEDGEARFIEPPVIL